MIEITNEPEFDFSSREYRELFFKFGLSPFQHPNWLEPFYRRLPAAAGQIPLILVGRQTGTGQLCSVFPLLRDKNTTKPHVTFAVLKVTDYACPVIDPAVFGRIAIRKEVHRLLGDHVLEVAPIHSEHKQIWSELAGCLPIPLDFGSHAIGFGPANDPITGNGRAKTISSLHRKRRRLAELGDLWIETVEGPEAGASIQIARRFRAGRFKGDPLQVDPYSAFYSDVASNAEGPSRTFRLMCGGKVIAVMFGLIHLRRFYYIILACDYAQYAKYSPGLLIMDSAIKAWADAGGEVFDFTIGDEPFKARFGCKRLEMYSIRSGCQRIAN